MSVSLNCVLKAPITMVQDLSMGKVGVLAAGLLVIVIINYIRLWLRPGLRNLPGPRIARFRYLYRLLMVYRGNGPSNYRLLHEKYGPIVRVGPNGFRLLIRRLFRRYTGFGASSQR